MPTKTGNGVGFIVFQDFETVNKVLSHAEIHLVSNHKVTQETLFLTSFNSGQIEVRGSMLAKNVKKTLAQKNDLKDANSKKTPMAQSLMVELSAGGPSEEITEDRVKSNSISLIDDLAYQSQSRRRNCSLHMSMLPTLDLYQSQEIKEDLEEQESSDEECEDDLLDKRPSIFKTIVPDQSQLHLSTLHRDSQSVFNLKTSVVYPSWLSVQKSIAFDTTMPGSETPTIRATLNDRIEEFKQELSIFCVDEGEEEIDFSESSNSTQNKQTQSLKVNQMTKLDILADQERD